MRGHGHVPHGHSNSMATSDPGGPLRPHIAQGIPRLSLTASWRASEPISSARAAQNSYKVRMQPGAGCEHVQTQGRGGDEVQAYGCTSWASAADRILPVTSCVHL